MGELQEDYLGPEKGRFWDDSLETAIASVTSGGPGSLDRWTDGVIQPISQSVTVEQPTAFLTEGTCFVDQFLLPSVSPEYTAVTDNFSVTITEPATFQETVDRVLEQLVPGEDSYGYSVMEEIASSVQDLHTAHVCSAQVCQDGENKFYKMLFHNQCEDVKKEFRMEDKESEEGRTYQEKRLQSDKLNFVTDFQ